VKEGGELMARKMEDWMRRAEAIVVGAALLLIGLAYVISRVWK